VPATKIWVAEDVFAKALIVNVNCVVRVSPPPTPVTVTLLKPEGVEGEVKIVKVTVLVGVTVQVG